MRQMQSKAINESMKIDPVNGQIKSFTSKSDVKYALGYEYEN